MMDTATRALLQNIEREYPSCVAYAHCNVPKVACIGKRMLDFCCVHRKEQLVDGLLPTILAAIHWDGAMLTSVVDKSFSIHALVINLEQKQQEDDDEEDDLIPDLVDVDDDDGVTSTSTALFNDARVRNRYGFFLHGSLRQFTLDHHWPSDLSSQAEVRAAWLPPHQIPRLVAVGTPASEPA